VGKPRKPRRPRNLQVRYGMSLALGLKPIVFLHHQGITERFTTHAARRFAAKLTRAAEWLESKEGKRG
jgi:hypothetical protein